MSNTQYEKSNPFTCLKVSAKRGILCPIRFRSNRTYNRHQITILNDFTHIQCHKIKKYQDIRAYIQFGQGECLGVFVRFEIQSNSIQINVNLIDSNSSNESKIKKSKTQNYHIHSAKVSILGKIIPNHFSTN